VSLSEHQPDWRLKADCQSHDPELWFSEDSKDQATARKVCAGCPVQPDCLTLGRSSGPTVEFGIYGGTLPDERGRQEHLAALAAERLLAMQELAEAGMTITAIAELFGISRPRVSKLLSDAARLANVA
jgi:WhiB family redox-sensing transcriptional regulator